MRDELFINSQTPLKFENGYVISSHALLVMSLLIHGGIKNWFILVKRSATRYEGTAFPPSAAYMRQWISIGSDNGLSLIRRQAII